MVKHLYGGSNTVRAEVQLRPGGPVEEMEMEVHEVPVDPPTVPATEVDLEEDELVIEGEAWFFPLRELDEVETPLEREIGGSDVTVHNAEEGMTAWVEDADGRMLVTVMVYEPRWLAFYPDSEIYRGGGTIEDPAASRAPRCQEWTGSTRCASRSAFGSCSTSHWS